MSALIEVAGLQCGYGRLPVVRDLNLTVQAGEEGIRFLLVSGRPIREPVAWYGPIVMNTQAEIQQAVAELRNGSFITGHSQ